LSVGADEGLSNREVRVIKQFAQVRLGELEEACSPATTTPIWLSR
jgi:hypothetical protein